MTCSTSIVHFNFSLNPEINLNSIDKSNFLSSKESSQNIFINRSNKEDIGLTGQLLKKDCKQRNIKNQEKTAIEITPKKILQLKLNENFNPQVNNFNSNMNNGLSNGHDLNLDFDLSSNLIQQSNSTHSFSAPEFSNTAVSINPVSSVSSSCSNSIPFVNSSSVTMGLLNDKDNLSQNILFLKGNKIENGQRVDFNSDTQWTEIKSNLLDKVNILPQLNLNTLANDMKEDNDLKNATNCDLSTQTEKEQFSMSYFSTNDNDVVEDPIEMTEKFEICQEFDSKQLEIENVQHVKDLLKSGLCSDEYSSRTSNQHYFLSNNLTTDSVPIESTSNDLSEEQLSLQKQGIQLMRRIRRLQIQHTHKNLTKQMKLFVSSHQKLNSVNCQRFDIDFSKFINTPIDNTSQLKALLLKDFSPIKNDKLPIPESNSNLIFSNLIPSNVQQNLTNLNSTDLLRQKILSHKLIAHSSSNQTQVIENLSQPPKVSPNSLHQNDLPSFSATFPFDFQNNFSYLNSQEKQPNLCNISQKTLSQENKDKISTTLDTLRYNLRHLEEKYDSDATESSSGEESCDEFEVYENKVNITPTSTPVSHLPSAASAPKNYIPVRNRSAWKWCTERSAIASRWYWLQAQISDLESKLRQQNDIFRHLRATKGSVVFGEDEKTRRQFPSISSINATNISSNQQTSFSSSSSSPSVSQYNNGNNTNISLSSTNINFPSQQFDTNEPQTVLEEESSCMRTMPLVNIKKRKLVRSEQTLSMAVKKAAKHSSVQCSCNIYPSYVPPCVICNGRYSYMHSIDTEFMPYYERISLLDSSCHPVLCLPNDVPLGLHFMQFLKRETVNNRQVILRNKKKRNINNVPLPASDNNNNQKSIKNKLSSSLLSLKNKKKLDKTKKRRLSGESGKKSNRERLSSGCSSRAESPIPSPSPSDTSSNGPSISVHTPTTTSAPLQRRRRSEQHAFDINNIVIPYSIAAATRVERLQYKEIITPKWRINEEFSIPPPENVKREIFNNNNFEEEISECAFELRHSRCEEAERQRIMSYYVGLTKSQNMRKGTSRVRFESKSESADQSSQDSCSSKVKSKANNDCGYERKRHSSISKSLNREDTLYDELHEIVAPFELRQFPLPDNFYDLMVQESSIVEDDDEDDALLSRCNSAAKNSNIDSTDDGTHVSNSIVSSPSNTDMDLNDDEGIRGHEDIGEEKDDPEWKPSKD